MSSHNQAQRQPVTVALLPSGFDTVSTALSWSVMYLVAYPEVQERLHQELSKHGKDRHQGQQGKQHTTVKCCTELVSREHDVQMLLLVSQQKHCSHPFALSLQRETWIWIAHLVSLINRIYPFWRPSSWKSFVTLLSCPSPSLIGTAHLFRDVERSR